MSLDIVGTIDIIIKLGIEIKTRLDSLNQAAEDLKVLTTSLSFLLKVFENPGNEALIKTHRSEFVSILDILQSIAHSCTKCAKALNLDIVGATDATKKAEGRGHKIIRRLWAFGQIPDLLTEIQRKAVHLQQINNTVSIVIAEDIRLEQQRAKEVGNTDLVPLVKDAAPLDVNFSTSFASIDLVVGNLITECSQLRKRLQEAVLVPDTSFLQSFQAQNPEAVAFWKDRFQTGELNASALRYEMMYVSWARFIHIVETSLVLKNIPTSGFEAGTIDVFREQGSHYFIDQSGTRQLSSIRPLWLPALRYALDPQHKGYVKPQDYFNLLHDSSLSETLRRLVFENSGYGTLIECERARDDISLPAEIESTSDHVGWTAAQIVAVPTSNELGIVADHDLTESSSESLFASFNEINRDVYIYVRYLQTGQIERKSLATQVRPAGGISVGAAISICYELDSGGRAWSCDLHITEFRALNGGRYSITTGAGSSAFVFSAMPVGNCFDYKLSDDHSSSSAIPELSYALLGPSKVFCHPPQVGEKIQIEYEGLWYDSRVTLVDGDEIEYVDWNCLSSQVSIDIKEAQGKRDWVEEENDSLFFSAEQLNQLGKGTRRLWRPWRRNIRRYDVRPYRRFHIGDCVEAPVMYPDFRFHYHTIDDSQLYLPARIVGVQGDQYTIEFSPELSIYGWWLGRMELGEEIELVPGSDIKVKNPFDVNRVTLSMDLVRPYSEGPRPVLGIQSMKPPGLSAFQGVQLRNLDDLLEQNLWDDHLGDVRTYA